MIEYVQVMKFVDAVERTLLKGVVNSNEMNFDLYDDFYLINIWLTYVSIFESVRSQYTVQSVRNGDWCVLWIERGSRDA